MSPRRFVIAATIAALSTGPVVLAGSAQATPPFSVSVEHCGGGIAIVGYNTLTQALRVDRRAVTRQLAHPGVLRSVRLFRGQHAIKVSTRHC